MNDHACRVVSPDFIIEVLLDDYMVRASPVGSPHIAAALRLATSLSRGFVERPGELTVVLFKERLIVCQKCQQHLRLEKRRVYVFRYEREERTWVETFPTDNLRYVVRDGRCCLIAAEDE